MVFQYNESLRSFRVSNPSLAKQIRRHVWQKLQEAQSLDATWQPTAESADECFLLFGAGNTVQVTVKNTQDMTLVFANREKAAYNLDIFPNNSMMAHSASPGTVAPVSSYFETMRRLTIGPAEQTIYGWTNDRHYTTLIITGCTHYQAGINYPPELAYYVLEGTQLPKTLKVPSQRADFIVENWCRRFWKATGNRLHRIGGRVKDYPREVWSISGNETDCIWFEATDNHSPAFVLGKPYILQDPQQASPGHQIQAKDTYKSDLRNWVRL